MPEWFYKSDGAILVPTGQPLVSPSFPEDGGEEPEIGELYFIAADGTPCRVGFALGNGCSDHVMERKNYLHLAHSKMRPCALGSQPRIGELPAAIAGRVRILRDGADLWSVPFDTGDVKVSYTLAGLEHHHFKHPQHRRPGDVHVHFFGASTLSFAAGVRARDHDIFEVSAPPFTRPPRNRLRVSPRRTEPVAPEAL